MRRLAAGQIVLLTTVLYGMVDSSRRSWKDQHPQQRLREATAAALSRYLVSIVNSSRQSWSSDSSRLESSTPRFALRSPLRRRTHIARRRRRFFGGAAGTATGRRDEAMTSQFTKLFSFILANVHDPAAPEDSALRLPCYSCMSPYLEDHFPYLSHLYRKPMSFDMHCDRNTLDRSFLYIRNCTDMCVTLRINDVVGGRRRHGYVRGCLADILGYNHSLIRNINDNNQCLDTNARELFLLTASRQELEPSKLSICGCQNNLCNVASWHHLHSPLIFILIYLIFIHAH